ncbi:MAG: PAS domain-containing protein [Eubacteriales bacterium]
MELTATFQTITENIEHAFMVYKAGKKYSSFANQKALELYGEADGTVNVHELFLNHNRPDSYTDNQKRKLDSVGYLNTSDVVTKTKSGETKLSDVQVGYANPEKTEFFIIMVQKEDARMESAKNNVDLSYRADAILEYDDCLTILYCNHSFRQVLEAIDDSYLDYLQRQLAKTFRKDKKAQLLKEIHRALQRNKTYQTEVEIINLNGEKHWYSMDLQRRSFDDTGDKLLCSLVNIDERKKATVQLNSFTQYFEAMQSLSGESLFQIDVKTQVLHMRAELAKELNLQAEMEDYPNSVYHVIHPEDLDDYKEFSTRSLAGENRFLKVRFQSATGEYQWYELNSMNIYDEAGEAIEVLGKVKNVNEEQEIKNEYNQLNLYFDAMQNISDESIYVIDVETRTLLQKGAVAEELGIKGEVTGYPESVYPLIHPEDLDGFKDFANKALKGIGSFISVRVKRDENEYCWYELISKILKDETGKPTKIFGKMNNIQSAQALKEEFTTINQYYSAVQSLSGESLYTVNIKSKLVNCQGVAADELGLPPIIEGYPDCVFDLVLPEDLHDFKDFAYRSLSGEERKLELQIKNKNGSYQWYELHNMIIRDKTERPVEILGRIKNINKERNLEEDYSDLHQYFTAMQELSDDILWRIDVPTATMHHFLQGAKAEKLGRTFSDYVNVLINQKIIHPEDAEKFLSHRQEWLSGRIDSFAIRFAFKNEDYELYKITGQKIFDEQGNIVEVLGRLQNIQAEQKLKEDNSLLNQYLMAMQLFSDNYLYRIDVQTMTLYRIIQSDGEKIEVREVPDYVNTVISKNIVHPEDADSYRDYVQSWYDGEAEELSKYTVRFAIDSDIYQWYDIYGQKIYDDEGNLKEVFGKMVNIQSERELKEDYSMLNQYFNAIQKLSSDIVYRIDVKNMTLHHMVESGQADRLGNIIPDYVNTFIKEKIIHPEDIERYCDYVKEWLAGRNDSISLRFAIESEEYQWYKTSGQKIFDEKGELVEVLGRMENIQEEKDLKANFSVVNQYFHAMQELSKDILFHIDMKTKTMYHSDPNAQDFGVPVEIPDFVNTFIKNGFVRPEDAQAYRDYSEKLMSGENMSYQIQAAVGVGRYEWFDVKSKFIYDENGEPTEIFGKMKNIQQQKNLELRATHDLMTKVLNKVSFEEEVALIFENPKEEQKHALIFIDVDDFKEINDSFGHSFGDSLLTTVGKRLQRGVRLTDLVGRVGGDEFAVFLEQVEDVPSAVERTELLLSSLQREFTFGGITRTIQCSLGIAIYPDHGKTYADLVAKSDVALYASKRKGKNVATLYTKELEEY